jgi:hypothetical protein
MAVTKARLREQLEAAFADIADLQAQAVRMQNKSMAARQSVASVWELADLGEVPEYEIRTAAVRAG